MMVMMQPLWFEQYCCNVLGPFCKIQKMGIVFKKQINPLILQNVWAFLKTVAKFKFLLFLANKCLLFIFQHFSDR